MSTNAAKMGLDPEAVVVVGVLDAVADCLSALTHPNARKGSATSDERRASRERSRRIGGLMGERKRCSKRTAVGEPSIMPTVLRIEGFRFVIFSREGNEPPHVHAVKAERDAKFWLNPVSVAQNNGFRSAEMRYLLQIVPDNEAMLRRTWNEHFYKT